MALRDRLKRLERTAGPGFSVYHCTGCGERWRTPHDTLMAFHLFDLKRKKAARRDEEEPEPERHVAELLGHVGHLGADDKILDLAGGTSVVPPPLLTSVGVR